MATEPIEIDGEALNREMRDAPPPMVDDVTVLCDGRRLDSAEKVIGWLVEIGDLTPKAAEEALAHR